jgi:hypothetical protein
MKSNDLSPLFPTPFADTPDAGTLTYPIPATSSDDGRASLSKGFSKTNMTPLAAGGKPPDGTDMNGILKMLSVSCQRSEAGYVTPWTLDFANASGGYPKGAVVSYGGPDRLWVSMADDNTSTPGNNPTQWQLGLADTIKTYAKLTSDHKIVTMNVNAGGDTTGAYVQVNDADGTGYKVPTDAWIQAYLLKNYLPLTGGTMTGPVNISGPNDASNVVFFSNYKPKQGEDRFRWGTRYLPFYGNPTDVKGNVFTGYFDHYGFGQNAYRIQVNDFNDQPITRTWDFRSTGVITTPRNNDLFEIDGHDPNGRKVQAFNATYVDEQYVSFKNPFKSSSIILSLTVQDGGSFHTIGFRDLTSSGFRLSLHRWNGTVLEPETTETTICVQAIGPA